MYSRQKREVSPDLILVLTLMFPIFAEQFASVFLTMLSSLVSSNIDTNIINVTTLVSSVVSLPGALYGSIASGCAILMSHAMGAGDKNRARSLFTTSMHMGLTISFLVSLLALLFGSKLLRTVYPAMSEEFFRLGEVYAFFVAISFPVDFYQTNCIGIMRSCLDTKGAFVISMSVAVVNLGLKALFMIVFEMGIMGLCVALLLSKAFSVIVCSLMIKKIGIFKGCLSDFKNFIQKDSSKEIIHYGVVMCAQTFFASIGALFLTKILADMGDLQVTGFNISTSMQSLLSVVPNSLAFVAQIAAGRYKGAGDDAHSLKLSMRITLAASALHIAASLATLPFSENIAKLYTRDKEVVDLAVNVYKTYIFTMPWVWSFGNVLSAGIRGYGNVKQPALTIIISLWAFKIPATYFACSVMNLGAVGRTFVISLETALYGASFIGYYFLELYRIKKREKANLS